MAAGGPALEPERVANLGMRKRLHGEQDSFLPRCQRTASKALAKADLWEKQSWLLVDFFRHYFADSHTHLSIGKTRQSIWYFTELPRHLFANPASTILHFARHHPSA